MSAAAAKPTGAGNEKNDQIVEPREVDVLCGRGGMSNHHPGNEWYRRLIRSNRPLYRACPKHTKLLVSKAIVQAVEQQGGRFLERNRKTGYWYVVNHKRAVDKTSQGLRERDRDDEGKQSSGNRGKNGQGGRNGDDDDDDDGGDETMDSVPEVFSGRRTGKDGPTLGDLAAVAMKHADDARGGGGSGRGFSNDVNIGGNRNMNIHQQQQQPLMSSMKRTAAPAGPMLNGGTGDYYGEEANPMIGNKRPRLDRLGGGDNNFSNANKGLMGFNNRDAASSGFENEAVPMPPEAKPRESSMFGPFLSLFSSQSTLGPFTSFPSQGPMNLPSPNQLDEGRQQQQLQAFQERNSKLDYAAQMEKQQFQQQQNAYNALYSAADGGCAQYDNNSNPYGGNVRGMNGTARDREFGNQMMMSELELQHQLFQQQQHRQLLQQKQKQFGNNNFAAQSVNRAEMFSNNDSYSNSTGKRERDLNSNNNNAGDAIPPPVYTRLTSGISWCLSKFLPVSGGGGEQSAQPVEPSIFDNATEESSTNVDSDDGNNFGRQQQQHPRSFYDMQRNLINSQSKNPFFTRSRLDPSIQQQIKIPEPVSTELKISMIPPPPHKSGNNKNNGHNDIGRMHQSHQQQHHEQEEEEQYGNPTSSNGRGVQSEDLVGNDIASGLLQRASSFSKRKSRPIMPSLPYSTVGGNMHNGAAMFHQLQQAQMKQDEDDDGQMIPPHMRQQQQQVQQTMRNTVRSPIFGKKSRHSLEEDDDEEGDEQPPPMRRPNGNNIRNISEEETTGLMGIAEPTALEKSVSKTLLDLAGISSFFGNSTQDNNPSIQEDGENTENNGNPSFARRTSSKSRKSLLDDDDEPEEQAQFRQLSGGSFSRQQQQYYGESAIEARMRSV